MEQRSQIEALATDTSTKTVYKYYNKDGVAVFTTKEIFKGEDKIVIYPFYPIKRNDTIGRSKIKTIEFLGWSTLAGLPTDFKKKYGTSYSYGIKSLRLQQLMYILSPKFKDVDKLVIGIGVTTRFLKKTISFNWADLQAILGKVSKEFNYFDKNRKELLNNELSEFSTKFKKTKRGVHSGELKNFLNKFESFDNVADADIDALSVLFDHLPKSKISVTTNFIKTKDTINIAYLEDILSAFKKNISVKNDNEKAWQDFFAKYSWIFSQLFPYEVILRQKEAYVGGKTIENKDGKVVDFLYQNAFKDNFALIEIKTHRKDILKNVPYRGTDVFAMSDDLSGGINQCLDQKDNFIKEFGNKNKSFDPKCILVIGTKKTLSDEQAKCFELLRNNQKNVDIVTFDELQAKIEGLLKVISI